MLAVATIFRFFPPFRLALSNALMLRAAQGRPKEKMREGIKKVLTARDRWRAGWLVGLAGDDQLWRGGRGRFHALDGLGMRP